MTDGVARELEQAEARLVEAREEAWDASRRLLAAAIEVGRLRALAEVPDVPAYWSGSRWLTRYEGQHPDGRWVALAAREEVQGV